MISKFTLPFETSQTVVLLVRM